MQLPKITCYNPNIPVPLFYFYILSKGLNSGKPLDQPCPNCFIAVCDSKKDRDRFYWLCYSLWQSRSIEHHLIGSVIPFIRISIYRAILSKAFKSSQVHAVYFDHLVRLMIQHEAKAKAISTNLAQRKALLQKGIRYCLASHNNL
ncbi:MAG: hypothetical protein V9E90_01410 [Saprospiraceae bacterium]